MTFSPERRRFLGALAAACSVRAAAPTPWTELIRGESLAGWRATGNADWTIENGAIVGRQGPEGAAGDLFSESQWGDFELECEWRMRFPGNSGIWFRVGAPRTGYQADFLDQASHPGVLSGSVYCMGKAFIAENRNSASVRKNGWNRLRIVARGDHIRIVQNGIQIVDVRDATFPGPGSVGIQVHAGREFQGMEVRVRNFRIRPLEGA